MTRDLLPARRSLLALLLAGALASFSVAACGDDEQAGREGQGNAGASQEADRATRGAEAEARAIAQELKKLQREVSDSGRQLVEGSAAQRDAAERDLRAQEGRARELAERAERLAPDTPGRAELRAATRQTERGLADLQRFAQERQEDGLARANDELEAAEESLRSVADSLRRGAPEQEAREALDQLRDRVPEIPRP